MLAPQLPKIALVLLTAAACTAGDRGSANDTSASGRNADTTRVTTHDAVVALTRDVKDAERDMSVGAPCNVCVSDSLVSSIVRMKPDGSNLELFAAGVRNTVGFAWHPVTQELWFTDNGRDMCTRPVRR